MPIDHYNIIMVQVQIITTTIVISSVVDFFPRERSVKNNVIIDLF